MKLKPEQEAQAIALMKGLLLFKGCSDAQLKAVADHLEAKSFAKDKVVLMEQEISKMLYLLAQGSVGIWRRTQGDKKLVATLRAPDFFGEGSMFSEAAANALVKAQENCLLFTLARTAFDELAQKDVPFGLLVEVNMGEIETQRPPLLRPEEGNSSTESS